MSLQATQNFLARIYTDEDLRRAFLSEPEKVGRENGLTEVEAGDLAGILPEELNFFADTLFFKRLHEVGKLLPLTRKLMAKEFERRFREFAPRYTPRSIKKHLEDAVEFVEFLQAEKSTEPVWVTDAARYEQARLRFYNSRERFFARRFDYDIRLILQTCSHKTEIAEIREIRFSVRKTYAIWLRVRGVVRQFIW